MTNTAVNGSSTILRGDVVEQLRSFDDNTFDACLCDPPYLLEFMGKEFDKQHLQMEGSNDGQKMYQWHLGWCQELYRVLKPGAFAMVFGGTRTYYRLACALEDVGFEIRDTIEWVYGSGFPKSHDISKGIDKLQGNKREIIGDNPNHRPHSGVDYEGIYAGGNTGAAKITSAGSEQSALWSGYGTALKPAHEPIILCMKPCNGTYVENALEHGVAGLNIDGCRIGTGDNLDRPKVDTSSWHGNQWGANPQHTIRGEINPGNPLGRWPANLILSHTPYCQERMKSKDDIEKSLEFKESIADVDRSELVVWDCHPLCPVRLLDEQSGISKSSGGKTGGKLGGGDRIYGEFKSMERSNAGGLGDSGGASRFFYCAKVSTSERESGMIGNFPCRTCGNVNSETHLDEKGKLVRCSRNAHPTLKPIDLCRYLAILLLPPPREDDLRQIIVPFSGAGSEVAGALSAGWEMIIGIEVDPEYIKWSESRIPSLTSGPIKPTKRSPKSDPTLDLDLDIFS